MSDTPKTDKRASGIIGFFSGETVPAGFARELERSNNTLSDWIREEGQRTDTCTYHILGKEICQYCQCGKAKDIL